MVTTNSHLVDDTTMPWTGIAHATGPVQIVASQRNREVQDMSMTGPVDIVVPRSPR
jgi:hypothetical protein